MYFGGTHTLLRFADHFARSTASRLDFHCYDVGPGAVPAWRARSQPHSPPGRSTFTSAADTPHDLPPAMRRLPRSGRAPTRCCTCGSVQAKFYFVQDNEPQFYPAGAASGMVEETYRFGFPGIVNTPGLADVYRILWQSGCVIRPGGRPGPLPPSPVSRTTRRLRSGCSSTRVRNAEKLLRSRDRGVGQLKREHGDRVEIICAGENWNPAQFGLAGRIENLGVLGSLEEVAALYRSCDIGLVFMHTKHPSYQPLEFMASGMATVSNINPATEWLMRDGENCLLTPPLPTPTAERLGRLAKDAELRRQDRRRRVGGDSALSLG